MKTRLNSIRKHIRAKRSNKWDERSWSENVDGININSRLLAPTNIHKNSIILRWINGICNARVPMSNAMLFKMDAGKPQEQRSIYGLGRLEKRGKVEENG